jgi:hypothetical protein
LRVFFPTILPIKPKKKEIPIADRKYSATFFTASAANYLTYLFQPGWALISTRFELLMVEYLTAVET